MSSHPNNTIPFPKSTELEFEDTIKLFEEGYDNDLELLDRFISLLEKGCEAANYYIGCIYEAGEKGISKDLGKAIFYYNRGIENVGDIESYLALARIYFYGTGTDVDYEQAYNYYKRVENEADNPIAAFMLGKYYLEGILIDKDLTKAEECFQKAIDKGYVYGQRYMADLEKEKGNIFRSYLYIIKSVLNTFLIAIKDPRDIRLRQA